MLILLVILIETKLLFYKSEKKINSKTNKRQIKNYRNQIKSNFEEAKEPIEEINQKFISLKKICIYIKLFVISISVKLKRLIITVYNQKKNFIAYAYSFSQKQNLKDLEIIFIANASMDN